MHILLSWYMAKGKVFYRIDSNDFYFCCFELRTFKNTQRKRLSRASLSANLLWFYFRCYAMWTVFIISAIQICKFCWRRLFPFSGVSILCSGGLFLTELTHLKRPHYFLHWWFSSWYDKTNILIKTGHCYQVLSLVVLI